MANKKEFSAQTKAVAEGTRAAIRKADTVAPKQKVSYGLGAFSLALGVSELLLTRALARRSGLAAHYSPLLRTFGVREITSGIGLITGKKEQAWLWSRVVGDALDVGFLGYAFLKEKEAEKRARIAMSAAAVAPVVALDIVNVLRRNEPRAA